MKNLINLETFDDVRAFLENPTGRLADAFIEVLSSGAPHSRLVSSRLVEMSIKDTLLTKLGKELKKNKDAGMLKNDFILKSKTKSCLYELLKFIDKDVPDEERFSAMKSIFLKSISANASDEDELLAYELMQICKKLSSNDILHLKTIYDIASGGGTNIQGANTQTTGLEEWLNIVANKVGHKMRALVELSERNLVELKLIGNRRHADGSGIENSTTFRMTQFGMKLCEFISAYK